MHSIEQLAGLDARMWVLIYERVKVGSWLRFFGRYRLNLVYAGVMKVPRLLLLGAKYYPFYVHMLLPGYMLAAEDAIVTDLTNSALYEGIYHVADWFKRKGRLIVHVTRKEQNTPLSTGNNASRRIIQRIRDIMRSCVVHLTSGKLSSNLRLEKN